MIKTNVGWWLRRSALIALISLLMVGEAKASTGEMSGWEWLRLVTWPGAMVALGLSPIGKAMAGWLEASRLGGSEHRQAVQDIAAAVRTMAETQRQQATVLEKLQEGQTILLERTR